MNSLDPSTTGTPVAGAIAMPDGTQVQLTADQAEQLAAAVEEKQSEQRQLILDLIYELEGKRDESIRAKREIERRWIDDIRMYEGDDRLLSTKEFPSQNGDENLKPPVPHLIRARTDLWESRLCDMLVPTNDNVVDLKPTPDEDSVPPQGMPADQWQTQIDALRQDAEKRCEAMKRVVMDQMNACNAAKVHRRCIRDACRIGFGLTMGPLNAVRVKRSFKPGNRAPQVVEKPMPELREGDPWMFFPDMVPTMERAEHAHYLFIMSTADLYKLAENPGFDKGAIAAVLDSDPDFGEVAINIQNRSCFANEHEPLANKYPVWRYTGVIDKKYLSAIGLESSVTEKDGTLPPMVIGDLWYSGSSVLKAKVSPLFAAKDFRIPYYGYAPFPADDTMFGYSIPYLGRDSQRSAKAAWQIGLHNASVSSGPLVVARQGALRPKDGKYSIRGPKWFDVTDAAGDRALNDLVTVIDIPNVSAQAFDIFERAQALMDEELNTIQWASPETSEPTQTASGLAMLMNSRTILQRRASAIADDDLFGPEFERFVLWNNLYNQRADIKGDYDVIPLCQSVRLVKDIQAQQSMWFANLCQDPRFAGMYDPYELFVAIAKNVDIPRDRLITSKDKYQQWQQQQAQQPQADPIRQLQQNLLVEKTKSEQLRQQSMSLKMQTDQQNQQQQGNADAQNQLYSTQLEHQEFVTEKQLQAAQMASHERIASAQIQSDNFQATMNHNANTQKTGAIIDQSARRERTELIKTGAHAQIEMHKVAAQKAIAAKPEALPKGTFKAPATPKYRGGKR